MFTKNTPPANGLSEGPMIVACQWNMSSPTGPDNKTSECTLNELNISQTTYSFPYADYSNAQVAQNEDGAFNSRYSLEIELAQ
jgi:hypothetical protein